MANFNGTSYVSRTFLPKINVKISTHFYQGNKHYVILNSFSTNHRTRQDIRTARANFKPEIHLLMKKKSTKSENSTILVSRSCTESYIIIIMFVGHLKMFALTIPNSWLNVYRWSFYYSMYI